MKQITGKTVAFCAMLLLVGCGKTGAGDDWDAAASEIKSDETIVFFPTAGWFDETNEEWHLPVHGWIYEPEDSTVRSAAIEKILREKYGLAVTDETRGNFSRRVNLLLADNERGKRIVVYIAGGNFQLPESAENGHFEGTVVIPAQHAARYAKDGLIHFTAVTAGAAGRTFEGAVRLLDPAGLSVISDIDDTVKVSNVIDRRSLLEHTFLLDFIAAPGMAKLYREWSSDDVAFHFVSSSPWHLYEPLREFLGSSGFPPATFSLKSVRFRDETVFDLFKKGTETKPAAIRNILDRYPGRRFVLIGDSGEQDPEVYAALLRERPEQVIRIYIRNVTQEREDNERFDEVFENIDADRWQLFDDPGHPGLAIAPP